MDDDDPPPLGSQKVAKKMTEMLGSLSHFVLGVKELLNFDHQEEKLQRHARKIIALTEVAHETLIRDAKLKLYLFVTCSRKSLPFKKAYFKLLCMIRRHRGAFPPDLDERISRLLLPLHTNMNIDWWWLTPRADLGIEELLVFQPSVPRNKTATTPDVDAILMPPPDVLEKKRQAEIGRLAELEKKVMEMAPPPEKKRRLVPQQYPAGKPDDAGNPPRPGNRLTRTKTLPNFGILCTGKPPSC